MREDGKVDYVELPGGDLGAVKAFYGAAFGWSFVDYGPEYAAFNEGLDGGSVLPGFVLRLSGLLDRGRRPRRG